LIIEAATPELDPASDVCRFPELVRFGQDVARPLLHSALLPASKPHVKLLFSSSADATFAGAGILDTSMPVSILGHPNAVGARDGAFVVIAPCPKERPASALEADIDQLVQQAAGRLVVLVNPRIGNTPMLDTFESAYLMRPLSLAYLSDQYAQKIDRVSACVLRCYPHEWSVLYQSADDWRYAGQFEAQPRPEQLETLLKEVLTRERNEKIRREQSGE